MAMLRLRESTRSNPQRGVGCHEQCEKDEEEEGGQYDLLLENYIVEQVGAARTWPKAVWRR